MKATAAATSLGSAPTGWASWAAAKRGRVLAKLAWLILDHAEELARKVDALPVDQALHPAMQHTREGVRARTP